MYSAVVFHMDPFQCRLDTFGAWSCIKLLTTDCSMAQASTTKMWTGEGLTYMTCSYMMVPFIQIYRIEDLPGFENVNTDVYIYLYMLCMICAYVNTINTHRSQDFLDPAKNYTNRKQISTAQESTTTLLRYMSNHTQKQSQ